MTLEFLFIYTYLVLFVLVKQYVIIYFLFSSVYGENLWPHSKTIIKTVWRLEYFFKFTVSTFKWLCDVSGYF